MNILAINPWIYDFAAYDFWLKPYGFLVILTYLKSKGFNIDYIDCLERKITKGTFGRGKYYSEIVEKPAILKSIPRFFKRYGITHEEFENLIADKQPDFILISSSMTYWYPGIIEVVKIIKNRFPSIPIILGGTYATLCFEHAQKTILSDFIFRNEDLQEFFKLLNVTMEHQELYSFIPPYEYFYGQYEYVVFRSSWGCIFNCSYCAIKKLFPQFFLVPQENVLESIVKYAQKGIKEFVLYDDAFLYDKEYAKKLLSQIAQLNLDIHFHTPNALHLRFLDEEFALLLKRVWFINPHFGLETLNPHLQKIWGDKVNRDDLIKGTKLLKKGGFKPGEFSVYLLLGYPEQDLTELKNDVDFIHSLGARVSLSEYSPVPHTELFERYQDKFSEPLLHNNSIFGFFQEDRIRDFWKLKNYVRQLNKKFP